MPRNMTSPTGRRRPSPGAQTRVDAALADSFPASDPPPWTLGPPAWASDRDEAEAIPLHAFCHSRMVVLTTSASAQEAAQAMRTNGIGAVLVADDARVIGIVTDRDLALRIVAANRDPRATHLDEVVSKRLVTLAPDDTQSDALGIMRDHRVRRVPLIERGRAVGMVTLDDLVLEKAATLEELAGVVAAQIVVSGPAQTRPFDEWRSVERRYARGLNTWSRLAGRVQEGAHLENREDAERAIEIVLAAMVRRLSPMSSKKLIARLPAMLRARLLDLPAGPDASVTRASIEESVAAALSVQRSEAAVIVDVVGAFLARSVPASDAVGRRLPDDLRSILRPRRAAPRDTARAGRTRKPRRSARGAGVRRTAPK